MVKAPSLHKKSAYGDKFKSWRKGKSEKFKHKKNGGGSLKHQLRGLQRLLAKFKDKNDNDNDNDDNQERRQNLQTSIDSLQQQIAQRETQEKERANARKSHGARFLDRQRVMRQWDKLVKSSGSSDKKNINLEDRLFPICWDILYVAHFPLAQTSYLSLFQSNSERHYHRGRSLAKLVSARQHLCRIGQEKDQLERVAWVPNECYEMDWPTDWTVAQEHATYKYPSESAVAVDGNTDNNDDRFQVAASHESVLQAAQAMEAALDREEEQQTKEQDKTTISTAINENVDSIPKNQENDMEREEDEISDSDQDEADPLLTTATTAKPAPTAKPVFGSDESNNSDSSDEDEPLSKEEVAAMMKKTNGADSSSSDSSSDSDSSSSSDSDSGSDEESVGSNHQPAKTQQQSPKEDIQKQQPPKEKDDDTVQDDPMESHGFLMEADTQDAGQVFARAKEHIPERPDFFRGDKSQGWATQKQSHGNRGPPSGRGRFGGGGGQSYPKYQKRR